MKIILILLLVGCSIFKALLATDDYTYEILNAGDVKVGEYTFTRLDIFLQNHTDQIIVFKPTIQYVTCVDENGEEASIPDFIGPSWRTAFTSMVILPQLSKNPMGFIVENPLGVIGPLENIYKCEYSVRGNIYGVDGDDYSLIEKGASESGAIKSIKATVTINGLINSKE